MPSFFVMSIAMPRFTAGLRMRAGFPSASPYASFIAGCFSSARTIAHATKCVKETFERPSASRCRFRMRRFSSIVLTGMTRFVTAVGTPSDASMFRAIVAAPPEIATACSPARGPAAGGRARARQAGRAGAGSADAAGGSSGTGVERTEDSSPSSRAGRALRSPGTPLPVLVHRGRLEPVAGRRARARTGRCPRIPRAWRSGRGMRRGRSSEAPF